MDLESREPVKVERGGMSRGWRALFIVQFLIVVVLVIYVIFFASQKPTVIWERVPGAASPANLEKSAMETGSYHTPGDIYWIADLAEKALPFVVNIRSEYVPDELRERMRQREEGAEFREFRERDSREWRETLPEGMREFFREFGVPPEEFRRYHDFDMPRMGEGSGFILSEDGYIVTNAHVVAGFTKFTVMLDNGEEYDGELVGRDDIKDIAVIKIDASGLPHATLGDSDTIRTGEPAIAIGSPFGLKHTVTAGIVSAIDRLPVDIGVPENPRNSTTLIQTDASIDRGNSGGPLLNARGEVIGVNQAIIHYADRIGFALPINSVKNSIDQIIKHGSVRYPGIGIEINNLSEEEAERYEFDVKEGVLVHGVTDGMPGANAGIKPGYVITEINGVKITTNVELIAEIQKHEIGDRITLRIYPDGKKPAKEVLVVLEEIDLSGEVPWRR